MSVYTHDPTCSSIYKILSHPAHTCATKWRCIESAAKLGAGMATAATATARPFSTMRTSSLPEHIHAKCVGCEHVHTILCMCTQYYAAEHYKRQIATAITTVRPFSTMRTSLLPEHIHTKWVGCEYAHTWYA